VNPGGQTGFYESKVANPSLTWEKVRQANIGLDFSMLNNRLSASFDYFIEKNKDILIQNAISVMYGANAYMPEGKFENRGYEIQLGWNDRIQDFSYYINLNYSFAKNKIVYQNDVYLVIPVFSQLLCPFFLVLIPLDDNFLMYFAPLYHNRYNHST
jgi:outer membrane receptor protein involved in Fe transport